MFRYVGDFAATVRSSDNSCVHLVFHAVAVFGRIDPRPLFRHCILTHMVITLYYCSEKSEAFLVHAMMAYRGSRGIAPFILHFSTGSGDQLTAHPGLFTARKEPQYA